MVKYKKNRVSQSILSFTTPRDIIVKVCQQTDNLTVQCMRYYTTKKEL